MLTVQIYSQLIKDKLKYSALTYDNELRSSDELSYSNDAMSRQK